jgi:pimeloyl-ACP methyl ester carboxylesterase
MSKSGETVILIHGLWMHGLVFVPQQLRLESKGFAVRRFSYPSWSRHLRENADRLADFVAATRASTIHLVAHSLGGLVALTMLEQNADRRIRRLVLMGSPCCACHCGSFLAATPPLSPLIGHSIKDWLAQPMPAVPASVEIGIIAGTRSFGMGRVIPGLPRPNDGVVALAETQLPEARDSIALPVSHSGMLISANCGEQIARFLKTGSFIHA